MLHQNILEAIGRTPLIKLNRVGSHLNCQLYAKCEYLNPGGSIKDRIGYRMVIDAEKQGRIKPGDTLIEPTSGNTGIGLALAGAVKGYRVIITMPEKMSREKQVALEALGAEIIRTPTEASFDSPESHIGVAKKLQKQLPNAHILDQYANPSNPQVHYETTAAEIIEDLGGKIDMVVMGAGTGGTISGVAKRLREHNPKIQIIGADPEGSILGGGTTVASYKVEGIGYDFIPDVLDRSLVTEWVKTNDRQSFILARQLIREEGLLCGGSSGSAMAAALKVAGRLGKGQNCVVILPDGIRNYMTKFVDDRWMTDNRFSTPELEGGQVRDLLKTTQRLDLLTIDRDAKLSVALELMRKNGVSQIPVLQRGQLVGLITEQSLLSSISSQADLANLSIASSMERSVPTVEESTPLSTLQTMLHQNGRTVVVDHARHPIGILTKIDLVEWLANRG